MCTVEVNIPNRGNSKHKGSEMGTRLFSWGNGKFCSTKGRAEKEVRKIGSYHGENQGPEKSKKLYTVMY